DAAALRPVKRRGVPAMAPRGSLPQCFRPGRVPQRYPCPMVSRGESHLVGRFDARALIEARVAALVTNQPGVIVIDGAAGIGKSAVAFWGMAEAVEHGALDLEARCIQGSTVPFGALAG